MPPTQTCGLPRRRAFALQDSTSLCSIHRSWFDLRIPERDRRAKQHSGRIGRFRRCSVKPLDSSASFAKTASTLLAVAVLLALPSRADLVLKDSSYGPGTIIEDTVTHLDWLKLTVTQNRSVNDVSSKFGTGQEFAGFQYGDVVQVGQLFKDGGLP